MKFSKQCSWKKALTTGHEVKWQQSRKTTGVLAKTEPSRSVGPAASPSSLDWLKKKVRHKVDRIQESQRMGSVAV